MIDGEQDEDEKHLEEERGAIGRQMGETHKYQGLIEAPGMLDRIMNYKWMFTQPAARLSK